MNQELYSACGNKNETGKSWAELAKEFNFGDPEKLRGQYRREQKKIQSENIVHDENDNLVYRESEEIRQDGSIVSDKLIKIREMDSKNPKNLLEAHGFDSEQWILINAKNNFWNGMRPKDRGLITLFQSKITVKPQEENKITFVEINKFFEDYQSKTKSVSKFIARGYDKNGMILEINLADLHVGNIGVGMNNECSVYDKVNYVIDDVLSRIKNVKLSKIILVQNGDVLHFDTKGRTTTSMTHTVTSDGSTNSEIFDEGARVLINAIDKLEVVAPVEVIGIYGNHDATSSYMLMKAIEFYYRENKNVVIDAGHGSRKFRKFGQNLVFWQHGDMSKKNVTSLIQREARKEFGETKFAEIHLGNYHHQETLEADGVIIRYLPSITPTDEWHYDKGYTGAIQSVVSFLWDLNTGLREMWFSNI
jgi:hypothetical protein